MILLSGDLNKSVLETTAEIVCVVCKGDVTTNDNEIVLCDLCSVGFHQQCHEPTIPVWALELDAPWTCNYCQLDKKNPHIAMNPFEMESAEEQVNADDAFIPERDPFSELNDCSDLYMVVDDGSHVGVSKRVKRTCQQHRVIATPEEQLYYENGLIEEVHSLDRAEKNKQAHSDHQQLEEQGPLSIAQEQQKFEDRKSDIEENGYVLKQAKLNDNDRRKSGKEECRNSSTEDGISSVVTNERRFHVEKSKNCVYDCRKNEKCFDTSEVPPSLDSPKRFEGRQQVCEYKFKYSMLHNEVDKIAELEKRRILARAKFDGLKDCVNRRHCESKRPGSAGLRGNKALTNQMQSTESKIDSSDRSAISYRDFAPESLGQQKVCGYQSVSGDLIDCDLQKDSKQCKESKTGSFERYTKSESDVRVRGLEMSNEDKESRKMVDKRQEKNPIKNNSEYENNWKYGRLGNLDKQAEKHRSVSLDERIVRNANKIVRREAMHQNNSEDKRLVKDELKLTSEGPCEKNSQKSLNDYREEVRGAKGGIDSREKGQGKHEAESRCPREGHSDRKTSENNCRTNRGEFLKHVMEMDSWYTESEHSGGLGTPLKMNLEQEEEITRDESKVSKRKVLDSNMKSGEQNKPWSTEKLKLGTVDESLSFDKGEFELQANWMKEEVLSDGSSKCFSQKMQGMIDEYPKNTFEKNRASSLPENVVKFGRIDNIENEEALSSGLKAAINGLVDENQNIGRYHIDNGHDSAFWHTKGEKYVQPGSLEKHKSDLCVDYKKFDMDFFDTSQCLHSDFPVQFSDEKNESHGNILEKIPSLSKRSDECNLMMEPDIGNASSLDSPKHFLNNAFTEDSKESGYIENYAELSVDDLVIDTGDFNESPKVGEADDKDRVSDSFVRGSYERIHGHGYYEESRMTGMSELEAKNTHVRASPVGCTPSYMKGENIFPSYDDHNTNDCSELDDNAEIRPEKIGSITNLSELGKSQTESKLMSYSTSKLIEDRNRERFDKKSAEDFERRSPELKFTVKASNGIISVGSSLIDVDAVSRGKEAVLNNNKKHQIRPSLSPQNDMKSMTMNTAHPDLIQKTTSRDYSVSSRVGNRELKPWQPPSGITEKKSTADTEMTKRAPPFRPDELPSIDHDEKVHKERSNSIPASQTSAYELLFNRRKSQELANLAQLPKTAAPLDRSRNSNLCKKGCMSDSQSSPTDLIFEEENEYVESLGIRISDVCSLRKPDFDDADAMTRREEKEGQSRFLLDTNNANSALRYGGEGSEMQYESLYFKCEQPKDNLDTGLEACSVEYLTVDPSDSLNIMTTETVRDHEREEKRTNPSSVPQSNSFSHRSLERQRSSSLDSQPDNPTEELMTTSWETSKPAVKSYPEAGWQLSREKSKSTSELQSSSSLNQNIPSSQDLWEKQQISLQTQQSFFAEQQMSNEKARSTQTKEAKMPLVQQKAFAEPKRTSVDDISEQQRSLLARELQISVRKSLERSKRRKEHPKFLTGLLKATTYHPKAEHSEITTELPKIPAGAQQTFENTPEIPHVPPNTPTEGQMLIEKLLCEQANMSKVPEDDSDEYRKLTEKPKPMLHQKRRPSKDTASAPLDFRTTTNRLAFDLPGNNWLLQRLVSENKLRMDNVDENQQGCLKPKPEAAKVKKRHKRKRNKIKNRGSEKVTREAKKFTNGAKNSESNAEGSTDASADDVDSGNGRDMSQGGLEDSGKRSVKMNTEVDKDGGNPEKNTETCKTKAKIKRDSRYQFKRNIDKITKASVERDDIENAATKEAKEILVNDARGNNKFDAQNVSKRNRDKINVRRSIDSDKNGAGKVTGIENMKVRIKHTANNPNSYENNIPRINRYKDSQNYGRNVNDNIDDGKAVKNNGSNELKDFFERNPINDIDNVGSKRMKTLESSSVNTLCNEESNAQNNTESDVGASFDNAMITGKTATSCTTFQAELKRDSNLSSSIFPPTAKPTTSDAALSSSETLVEVSSDSNQCTGDRNIGLQTSQLSTGISTKDPLEIEQATSEMQSRLIARAAATHDGRAWSGDASTKRTTLTIQSLHSQNRSSLHTDGYEESSMSDSSFDQKSPSFKNSLKKESPCKESPFGDSRKGDYPYKGDDPSRRCYLTRPFKRQISLVCESTKISGLTKSNEEGLEISSEQRQWTVENKVLMKEQALASSNENQRRYADEMEPPVKLSRLSSPEKLCQQQATFESARPSQNSSEESLEPKTKLQKLDIHEIHSHYENKNDIEKLVGITVPGNLEPRANPQKLSDYHEQVINSGISRPADPTCQKNFFKIDVSSAEKNLMDISPSEHLNTNDYTYDVLNEMDAFLSSNSNSAAIDSHESKCTRTADLPRDLHALKSPAVMAIQSDEFSNTIATSSRSTTSEAAAQSTAIVKTSESPHHFITFVRSAVTSSSTSSDSSEVTKEDLGSHPNSLISAKALSQSTAAVSACSTTSSVRTPTSRSEGKPTRSTTLTESTPLSFSKEVPHYSTTSITLPYQVTTDMQTTVISHSSPASKTAVSSTPKTTTVTSPQSTTSKDSIDISSHSITPVKFTTASATSPTSGETAGILNSNVDTVAITQHSTMPRESKLAPYSNTKSTASMQPHPTPLISTTASPQTATCRETTSLQLKTTDAVTSAQSLALIPTSSTLTSVDKLSQVSTIVSNPAIRPKSSPTVDTKKTPLKSYTVTETTQIQSNAIVKFVEKSQNASIGINAKEPALLIAKTVGTEHSRALVAQNKRSWPANAHIKAKSSPREVASIQAYHCISGPVDSNVDSRINMFHRQLSNQRLAMQTSLQPERPPPPLHSVHYHHHDHHIHTPYLHPETPNPNITLAVQVNPALETKPMHEFFEQERMRKTNSAIHDPDPRIVNQTINRIAQPTPVHNMNLKPAGNPSLAQDHRNRSSMLDGRICNRNEANKIRYRSNEIGIPQNESQMEALRNNNLMNLLPITNPDSANGKSGPPQIVANQNNGLGNHPPRRQTQHIDISPDHCSPDNNRIVTDRSFRGPEAIQQLPRANSDSLIRHDLPLYPPRKAHALERSDGQPYRERNEEENNKKDILSKIFNDSSISDSTKQEIWDYMSRPNAKPLPSENRSIEHRKAEFMDLMKSRTSTLPLPNAVNLGAPSRMRQDRGPQQANIAPQPYPLAINPSQAVVDRSTKMELLTRNNSMVQNAPMTLESIRNAVMAQREQKSLLQGRFLNERMNHGLRSNASLNMPFVDANAIERSRQDLQKAHLAAAQVSPGHQVPTVNGIPALHNLPSGLPNVPRQPHSQGFTGAQGNPHHLLISSPEAAKQPMSRSASSLHFNRFAPHLQARNDIRSISRDLSGAAEVNNTVRRGIPNNDPVSRMLPEAYRHPEREVSQHQTELERLRFGGQRQIETRVHHPRSDRPSALTSSAGHQIITLVEDHGNFQGYGQRKISTERQERAEKTRETCLACGKEAVFVCSQCRSGWYCCQNCQVMS